jgi:ABC-type polysaccharide/polyol phosphate transport system ATPase subunit
MPMSDLAIRIVALSKQYRIGPNQGAYTTLRDTVTDVLMSPVRGAVKLWRGHAPRAAERRDTIWALREVSCEIKRGEIVGIIGHNGAGKSTLLKILSRITKPTTGVAEIHGRVGSLLEVGTGFHPELTGRENIYLNGSILGMKRAEIARKFDEIVAFAEVETFIDTPVKYYSSGMYLRLAFAVAAHLEPDILLVDEVLAVGDARFWSKCINKIQALNEQGMTITLISHYLWLIQTLCSRAMCLDRGRIVIDGDPLKVIGMYRALNEGLQESQSIAPQGQEAAAIVNFQVFPAGTWASEREAFPDSGMTVVLVAQVHYPAKVKVRLRATSPDGFAYFTVYSDLIDTSQRGRIECKATIPHLMLMPGDYFLWGGICSDEAEEQALAEEHLPFFVTGTVASTQRFGIFWNYADWQIRHAD